MFQFKKNVKGWKFETRLSTSEQIPDKQGLVDVKKQEHLSSIAIKIQMQFFFI